MSKYKQDKKWYEGFLHAETTYKNGWRVLYHGHYSDTFLVIWAPTGHFNYDETVEDESECSSFYDGVADYSEHFKLNKGILK